MWIDPGIFQKGVRVSKGVCGMEVPKWSRGESRTVSNIGVFIPYKLNKMLHYCTTLTFSCMKLKDLIDESQR